MQKSHNFNACFFAYAAAIIDQLSRRWNNAWALCFVFLFQLFSSWAFLPPPSASFNFLFFIFSHHFMMLYNNNNKSCFSSLIFLFLLRRLLLNAMNEMEMKMGKWRETINGFLFELIVYRSLPSHRQYNLSSLTKSIPHRWDYYHQRNNIFFHPFSDLDW